MCLALIALLVLFNFRSVRYVVPIVPSLCLLLAVVVQRFFEQRSAVRIATAVLLALMLIASLTQAEIQIYLRQRNGSAQVVNGKLKTHIVEENVAEEKRLAEELGVSQQPDTEMVLIKNNRGNTVLKVPHHARAWVGAQIGSTSFMATYGFRSQD